MFWVLRLEDAKKRSSNGRLNRAQAALRGVYEWRSAATTGNTGLAPHGQQLQGQSLAWPCAKPAAEGWRGV